MLVAEGRGRGLGWEACGATSDGAGSGVAAGVVADFCAADTNTSITTTNIPVLIKSNNPMSIATWISQIWVELFSPIIPYKLFLKNTK